MKFKNINWSLVWEYFMAIFFPPSCCCCDADVNPGEYLCSDCSAELETLKIKKPLLRTVNGRRYRIHAVYQYSEDNAPSTIVKRHKFSQKPYGARFMGAKIAEKAIRLGRDYDVITFVPMSRLKEIKTQYNHCDFIAYGASLVLKVKYKECLKKIRNTKNQHDLSRVDRQRNLIGAFKAKRNVEGKRILLVDDVCTTGATLCECAKVLYEKGAESVTLIAFSMVKRKS